MSASPVSAPLKGKPWYREPWPWILMAGPFLVVIGCAVTLYVAYVRFSDQSIQEGVFKRGLVVERKDAIPPPVAPPASSSASPSSPANGIEPIR